jgi:soluble lytic murein transglycosylase
MKRRTLITLFPISLAIACSAQPRGETAQTPEDRYRLGSRAFEKSHFPETQRQLDGLGKSLPALAERIDLKLALSRGQGNDWLKAHPQSFLIPDALSFLAVRKNTEATNKLLQRYPDHPRTAAALELLLGAQPKNRQWLTHLMRYFPANPRSQLSAKQLQALGNLTPVEWEAVAMASKPPEAALAYQKAPINPTNLLAHAEVLRTLGKKPEAANLLTQVIQKFPKDPLAFESQLARADLLPPDEALALLASTERQYPKRGDEAVWAGIQVWVRRRNQASGALDLDLHLVNKYPTSQKAPNAAWELASNAANQGDLATAQKYARFILNRHPKDAFAPKAAFWSGKWAEQLGDTKTAKIQYASILEQYPHSYYAWRSAVHLGRANGDFNVGLTNNLPVNWDAPAPPIVGGSPALKALIGLGEYDEALRQWRSETYGRSFTPAEQLTEAFFQARSGRNMKAINLSARGIAAEPPKDPRSYAQTYPLFFAAPLRQWSKDRGLNPLFVASLIRQESRFETTIRSRSNAVGLMQLLPSTAKYIADKVKESAPYDLDKPDDNLRLGTAYLRYTHQKWDGDTLLATASYNAGPGNVARWVKQIPMTDLETFIEQIPFRETRSYVINIYENYWNYLQLYST